MTDGPHDPDSFTPEEYNQYILEQIKIHLGGEEVITTFNQRKHNINGKTIGISNDNPLLDTRIYEVEMTDGYVK